MKEDNIFKRLKRYVDAIDERINECREELIKRLDPSISCCLTGEITGHQLDKRRLYILFPELENYKKE